MSRPVQSVLSLPLYSFGACSQIRLRCTSPTTTLYHLPTPAPLLALTPISCRGIASSHTNLVPPSFAFNGVLSSSCLTNSLPRKIYKLFTKKGQILKQFKLKPSLGAIIDGQLGTAAEDVMNNPPVFTSADHEDDVVKRSKSILKLAAKTKKVAGAEVIEAMMLLEKARLDPSSFLETIGGTKSPGRTWMLVFVANTQKVTTKGGGRSEQGGRYFPITAVQRFDTATRSIENGIFLGPIGFLTFQGKFSWDKRIMAFLFTILNVKIGPFSALKFDITKESRVPGKKDPFFVWHYADDEIIVSRGRSGGLAFWCRCKNVSA